jgi:hypothetical protein
MDCGTYGTAFTTGSNPSHFEGIPGMILVRLLDGRADEEDVATLYDTRMACVPRVGETITIRTPDRSLTKYRVKEVDYLLEFKDTLSAEDELVGVRLTVEFL